MRFESKEKEAVGSISSLINKTPLNFEISSGKKRVKNLSMDASNTINEFGNPINFRKAKKTVITGKLYDASAGVKSEIMKNNRTGFVSRSLYTDQTKTTNNNNIITTNSTDNNINGGFKNSLT